MNGSKWVIMGIFIHIMPLQQEVNCQHGIGMVRTRRQNGSSLNDKPPSFVHPDCRPFGGICAGVEYQIHLQPGIVPGIQPLPVIPKAIEARDLEYSKTVTYKFINGTPDNYEMYFFMDPSSGAVSQVRPVPFMEMDKYVIYFTAQEVGPRGLHSVAKLTVYVDNGAENLHDPVLEASGVHGYIEENAPIGTTVRIGMQPGAEPLQILVTDEDLRPGMSPATYQYILMGIGASIFAVNQGGYVYLNSPTLDADGVNPKTYAITIQAREVGTAPIRSSQAVSIKIDVLDVNDNEPSFDSQVYQATASSGLTTQNILKVKARDADGGRFGELRYSIVSVTNNGEGLFRYNKDTQTLTSTGVLTPGNQYQVLIQATDGGGRSAQAIVVVDVIDAATSTVSSPSTSTVVLPSMITTSISESAPIGANVIHLQGGNNARYKLLNGNEENMFRLDPVTGDITIATPLDREITELYNLTVLVTAANMNSTIVVSVTVNDENDHAPIISNVKPIIFTVEDGTQANTVIGRVRVQDPDAGENGTVKLSIDLNSSASFFSLDPDGTLRSRTVLRSSDKEVHRLRIVARDNGTPSKESSEDIEIRVVDKSKQFPYFENDNYVIEIDENVGPGELITVRAKPAIGDSPVTYLLRQGDPTLFSVDPKTGTVSSLANMDAELQHTHFLIVGTRENQGEVPGAVANIEVHVKDVNDWIPTFQPQSYAVTVLDSVPVGTSVLRVTAVDQDAEEPNNVIRYRLIGNENGTSFFSVNATSGVIAVKKSLRNSRVRETTLLIEARDSGPPPLSSTANVVVQLQRLLGQDSSFIFTEELVTRARAPSLPFSTPGPAQKPAQFSASQYSSSVLEGIISDFVLVLPVENKPSDLHQLRCSVVTGNDEGLFTTNVNEQGDCELVLRGTVDRESIDRYTLNISVSSTISNDSRVINYAQVVMEVIDVNDNAPQFVFDSDSDSSGSFNTYFAALASEKPPFSHVITVQALDSDSAINNRVSYSLDSSSFDSQYFLINSTIGQITNAMLLPSRVHESIPYFQFRVVANDNPPNGQSLSSKADVVVNTLTDSNRFIMTLDGVRSTLTDRYIPDIKRSMQSRMGKCKALGVEYVTETNDTSTDIVWFAVDPISKLICNHSQFDTLFDKMNIDRIKGELSGRINIRQLRQASTGQRDQLMTEIGTVASGLFSYNRWQAAEIALIVLACVIVIGAVIGILAMCYLWSRRQESKIVPNDHVQFYTAVPKYNALMFPPSEKDYETQIMEMSVPGEHGMDKVCGIDYGLEEGIYRRQPPPHVYIPPPDYPNQGFIINPMEVNGRRSMAPAPAQRKRNGEKTTIL